MMPPLATTAATTLSTAAAYITAAQNQHISTHLQHLISSNDASKHIIWAQSVFFVTMYLILLTLFLFVFFFHTHAELHTHSWCLIGPNDIKMHCLGPVCSYYYLMLLTLFLFTNYVTSS